jgi:hypothetical protein
VNGSCTLVDAITAAETDVATGFCPAGSGPDEIQLTTDVTLTAVNNSATGAGLLPDGANGLPVITSAITIKGNNHTVSRQSGSPAFRIFIVDQLGDLTIQNTTVSNGGGPSFENGGGAVASASGSTITLENSTLSGNSAGGGTGYGGGFLNKSNSATLTNSTVSGNSSGGNGGGISNYGILTIANSTISGNSASYYGGGIDNPGAVIATNATFSGNSAGYDGGAIYNFGVSTQFNVTNSLLANNAGGNCGGAFDPDDDKGGNLADDTTCGTIPGTLTGLDPSLEDHGGPTLTHGLLTTSNAIGLAGACGLATDQRGALRSDGACDRGAFEFIPCPDLPLRDHTVDASETEENCQNIVVGPTYAVGATGVLTLNSGRAVILKDGTSVDSGGQLTISIDTDLQLTPP